jgi:hypothetical protein
MYKMVFLIAILTLSIANCVPKVRRSAAAPCRAALALLLNHGEHIGVTNENPRTSLLL